MTKNYGTPDDYELRDYDDYEHYPLSGEFSVYSPTLNRSFYGQTLTLARTQRSEAERIYYEHHMKGHNS